MIKLLVLTCGTNACFHFIKTLREKFSTEDFYIVGTDINKPWMVSCAKYLNRFYQCPLTDDSAYYDFIIGICDKEKIDYLLPSFDEDQRLFASDNADLLSMGVTSFGVCKETMKIYSSKERMNLFLEKNNFPIPRMITRQELEDDKEYFVKPVQGVASIGARRLKGFEIKQIAEEIVVQEICKEPEVTLECFYYDRKLQTIARERKGVKSGICTKAKIYHSIKLESIARQFAEKLKVPYAFNMQFMYNQLGEPVITDVNLRLAGGMSMSYAAGWDEVSALAEIMLGKNEEDVLSHVNRKLITQYVIRAYTDIVTKTCKRIVAFDLDGTLLDSRQRHQALMEDLLKKYGLKISLEDYLSYKADGHTNIQWLKMKGVDDEQSDAINKEWVTYIEDERYLINDKLYPNALKLLNEYEQDASLLLVTARNNENNVRAQICKLGLEQHFEDVIVVPSNRQTENLKAEVLINNHVELYIGDTEADFSAAKIAKCDFLATEYGFRSKTFWQDKLKENQIIRL